jgi:WD40 repeat protein
LHDLEHSDPQGRRIFRLDRDVAYIRVDPNLTRLVAVDESLQVVFVWDLSVRDSMPYRMFDVGDLRISRFLIDGAGMQVAAAGIMDDGAIVRVWDLSAPKGAGPIRCRMPDLRWLNGCAFDPNGSWVTAGLVATAPFWPLTSNRPLVFRNDGRVLGFLPDGKSLVTSGPDWIRLRALDDGGIDRQLAYSTPTIYPWGVHLDGEHEIVVGSDNFSMLVAALDGSGLTKLDGFDNSAGFPFLAYDPNRQLVAVAPNTGSPEQKVIQVRNLHSGPVRLLGPTEDAGEGFVGGYGPMFFLPDGNLLTSGTAGIRHWNLESGSSTIVFSGGAVVAGVTPDGRLAVVAKWADVATGPLQLLDLESLEVNRLPGWLPNAGTAALSPNGDVLATGNSEGLIQVGLLSGGEPLRLYEPTARIESLAFSADGKKLAAADLVGTVRIWNLPDLSATPFHALPYDELVEKLDEFTNLRIVRNEESSSGWEVEVGPFPGWETVPSW